MMEIYQRRRGRCFEMRCLLPRAQARGYIECLAVDIADRASRHHNANDSQHMRRTPLMP